VKFNIIVGNLPYQLVDGGGTGDSAKSIYHLFVRQSKKMKPKHLSLIIPSRWMKGGKGLTNFRLDMMNDEHIKTIYDFQDAKEIFPGIHLDGGACYFYWDKNYQGETQYYYKDLEGTIIESIRPLRSNLTNTVIRDQRQIPIIEKSIDSVESYKLFFSKAYTTTSTIPPTIITGMPGTICTETFLKIGDFESDLHVKNC
jgi:site-specific DNA-methyltransferase (adenine-specific)